MYSEYTPTENDWVQDFTHENGNYTCTCCICHTIFRGHKRRVVCMKCSEPVDHGAGIDAYYRRKREDRDREHAKYVQMKREGVSSQELAKQEQIWLDAGNTGD